MSEHYTQGYGDLIEVLDVLKDKLTPEQFIGFCLGNMIKYTLRANFKGAFTKDLEKAEHYGEILNEFLQDQVLSTMDAGQVGDTLHGEED